MSTFFMEKSFTIKVDGQPDFHLSEDDITALDLLKTHGGHYHLLKDGTSYHIQVASSNINDRTYTLMVNGSEYQTKINTPLDALIQKMGFATEGTKNINTIVAPMPGLILDISVKEGQEVEEDDALVILEAMKMENIISSPRAGTIKKIAVKQGDAVDKSQLLIEFE
ncbi:acetyl-CoA carboxylase biotin carboxyl carrier protein subunit [Flagellimonas myxillae]|uniref:acetyl-CoA carboxylase biotin carboxyl carrier protein subunit n=1 Tax=Flagellimonas myxillae TaxID=2942214 RepID=UPI00201F1A3A|nr:acetyl-CoA carboxylase biotin carboxyl carrier protein subunit [Muricauda myxillae]MCL6265395.1 acetyl-CoA carboxylase biotin carboxyl carrier protein subunit [Muricauda myxillae]